MSVVFAGASHLTRSRGSGKSEHLNPDTDELNVVTADPRLLVRMLAQATLVGFERRGLTSVANPLTRMQALLVG